MHYWSMQKVALGHLFRPSPGNLELRIGLLQALSFVAPLFFQELKGIQACLPPKPEHHLSLSRASYEKKNTTPPGNSQFTSFYEDGDNSKQTKDDFKPSYSHFQIPNHIHLVISYLFLSKTESLMQLFPYLSKTKTLSWSSTWP